MDSSFLSSEGPPTKPNEPSVSPTEPLGGGGSIGVGTLFQFLIGRREAILKIAATPAALGACALLVLSAGLARNYDKPALWRQPWRLLGPFGASLATNALLFVTLFGLAWLRRMERPGLVRAYFTFLTIYWATAPLAWLYGIPYECLLDPLDALEANLWTLAIVSLWRVALVIRATSVLIAVRALAVFPVVMLIVTAIAFLAIMFSPVPLINVMAGVENPRAKLISGKAVAVLMLSLFTFPVWLILSSAAVYIWNPVWSVPQPRPARLTWRLYGFAVASVLAWTLLALMAP